MYAPAISWPARWVTKVHVTLAPLAAAMGRTTRRSEAGKSAGDSPAVICLAPYRPRWLGPGEEWIAIRPGSEAAVCLALAHVLLQSGATDASVGVDFEAYRDQVAAFAKGHLAGAGAQLQAGSVEDP